MASLSRNRPGVGRIERLPQVLRPLGRMARSIFKFMRRGMRRTIEDIAWSSDQRLRRLSMKLLSPESLERLKQELMQDNKVHRPECLITAAMGSRHLGNRDNRLKHFLRSLVEMTDKLERVEILIKVDDDDDLLFYRRMKRKCQGKIDMRFLISERGRGHADMHKFYAALLQLRSPSSRCYFALSEDAIFVSPKWDSELLSVLSNYPDDCFIATQSSLQEAIAVHGAYPVHPVPVYWMGVTMFPIIGFGVIKCTQAVAGKYPGWTCFGNRSNIEGISCGILKQLWQRHQVNLNVRTSEFVQRTGVVNWSENEERTRMRSDALIEFWSEENQKVRDEMADAIYQYVTERDRQSAPKGEA